MNGTHDTRPRPWETLIMLCAAASGAMTVALATSAFGQTNECRDKPPALDSYHPEHENIFALSCQIANLQKQVEELRWHTHPNICWDADGYRRECPVLRKEPKP